MVKTLAAAAALTLVVTAAEAAPIRAGASLETVRSQSAQTVHFFYYEEDDDYAPPPVYRRPHRVYPAPAYGHYPPRPVEPHYGFYDREDAKDYVKGYRRAQKEMFKDRVRAWNRTQGF